MNHTPRSTGAARYSPPGEGAPVPIRRFRTLVKVPASDTGRRYSLLEHALDPETLAMPMHRHQGETKTFYAIEGSLTVMQAIAMAGGASDKGAPNRVRIFRTVDGKQQEIKGVKLSDLVKAGDTIDVPQRYF